MGRGHVDEKKSAGEKSFEINAVTKSSNDQRVWESCEGVGDPEEAIVFLIGTRARRRSQGQCCLP